MNLPVLRRRRHGGSFFTMVIFIMMLISTMLMYYYFQRSKALERDIRAVQRGELAPADAGKSFVERLPWVETSANQPASLSAEPTEASDIVSPQPPSPPPAPPASTSVEAPNEQTYQTEPQQGVVPSEEADNRLRLEALPPEAATITEDESDPAEDSSPDDYADEASPDDDAEPSGPDNPEQEQDEPEPDAAEPAGESLYDMDPPPVRVRAPRRN